MPSLVKPFIDVLFSATPTTKTCFREVFQFWQREICPEKFPTYFFMR